MRGGFLPRYLRDGFLTQPGSFVEVAEGGGDPMAGVTQDATSGIYVPASDAEWTTTMSAAGLATGNPSALWLCQEAAGNLADSIGAFTLTAGGTPNYRQAIAGWTRLGLVLDAGSADGFSSASASLPDLSTTSQLIVAYVRRPGAAPGANQSLIALGAAGTRATVVINTTPRLVAASGANSATGTVAAADSAVSPLAIKHNKTGTEADVYTEAEKISPALSASVAGKQVLFGNAGALSAGFGLLYAASFHGAAAELTDAQIKTLLQTLGWTVAW